MIVANSGQHEINVPYGKPPSSGVRDVLRLRPGYTEVDDAIWAEVKPRLESRLSDGRLREVKGTSGKLTKGEVHRILAGPDSADILALCSRATPVSSGHWQGQADSRQFELIEEQLRQGA